MMKNDYILSEQKELQKKIEKKKIIEERIVVQHVRINDLEKQLELLEAQKRELGKQIHAESISLSALQRQLEKTIDSIEKQVLFLQKISEQAHQG